MDISKFDYELDHSLIAQKPFFPRDHSRLLACLDQNPEDILFKDLPKLLNSGDVLVINNTKVIPSRLFGKRDQVSIEVTLHLNIDKNIFNQRKMKWDEEVENNNGIHPNVGNANTRLLNRMRCSAVSAIFGAGMHPNRELYVNSPRDPLDVGFTPENKYKSL